MEEFHEINLRSWILSGSGCQGESYRHRTDEGLLLKLFSAKSGSAEARREFDMAVAVRSRGIPSPEPVRLVKSGERYGIIYRRIQNKKSFCRASGEDPSMIEPLARRLASMGRELHSKTSEGSPFGSIVAYYDSLLSANRSLDDRMRGKIADALETVRKEDRNTLLHGDFHFGNAVTDGVKDYFIDLGAFSYGNPDFDNSILYYLCSMGPDSYLDKEYHISREAALKFWDCYRKAYYGPEAPSDAELKRRYLPYILVRTLFFEQALGQAKILDDIREGIVKDMDL